MITPCNVRTMLILIVGLAHAAAVCAQQENGGNEPLQNPDHSPQKPNHSSSRMLEEIVVTAQKREENVQDVPISIQAFGSQKLEALGIDTVQDLQRISPGFTLTSSAGFNIAFLRGVGSDAFLPGIDSSVPFYLDGVPLLAIQSTSDTLGRVERVEVLKGPQGTLFGRNATGGAISVITPQPGQEFSGEFKAEVGNYNQENATFYLNVPVTNSVAFNLSGFRNRRENHITSFGGGEPDIYSRGGRAKLRWDVLDSLSVTLSGSYQRNQGNGGVDWQLTRPAPVLSGAGIILPADSEFDRTLERDGPLGTEVESHVISGIIDWNLNWFDIKLTYASQEMEVLEVASDFDGTRFPLVYAYGGGVEGSGQFLEQDTVELQILSSATGPGAEYFEWVAGIFYLESFGGFDPVAIPVAPDLLNVILPLPGIGTLTSVLDQALQAANLPGLSDGAVKLANYGLIDTESYSAYAQATFYLTSNIDGTVGVRIQREYRDLVGSRTSLLSSDHEEIPLPIPHANLPTLSATQVSPRFALQWRPFNDESQIYASLARAYKSPTYNAVNFVGNVFGTMVPLKEERVDTAELGFKANLWNGNLRLNASAFLTKQKDPLSGNVSIQSGGFTYFTNAGSAEIKGAEVDFLVTPLPERNAGLVVSGAASYLNAKYTSFENGQGFDDSTGLGFGDGGARLPARDLSGKRIPRVPEWTYQLTLSQRIEFGNYRHAVELAGDVFYTSKIYFSPQNSELSTRDPVHQFNARATYFYTPWDVELTTFVNNLTDEVYVDSAFITDFGIAPIANSNPRLYGLRLKYSY